MKGHRRRSILGGGALGVGAVTAPALLAACGPGDTPSGQPGQAGQPGQPGQRTDKVVTIVGSSIPTTVDPAQMLTQPGLLTWGMGEMLARVNPKGQLEPWLATGWRTLDPRRWEFKLRDGISFWDGAPMDASAVKASLERSLALQPGAPENLRASAIEVVDARTLVISTEVPHAVVPAVMADVTFIIHNAKLAIARGNEAFAREPSMTGPYKPVDFRRDESMTLVRHDAYWGGKPALARIEVKVVREGETRVLALQSGQADMARDVPSESGNLLRKQPGIFVPETLAASLVYLFLNQRQAPLDDPVVRRAVSLAIDRKALIDQVLAGVGEAPGDVYAPMYPWAQKNLYPSDPAKAAKLLDEAGWRLGPDGVRQKNGKQIAFTLLTYPTNADNQPLGIALQAQFKKVGISVDLKSVEQIAPALKGTGWGAGLYHNNSASNGDPQYLLDTFIRSDAPRPFGYSNAAMDRLIEQIRGTTDSAERMKLIRRAQDFLAEEAPMLPLVVKKERLFVNEKLKSAQPHPSSWYMLHADFGR